MPQICHNPEITKILSLDNNKPIDNIVEVLQTLTPFMATFAHEILRKLNAGLVKQFQTRLTNIQTINKIVQLIISKEEETYKDAMFMIEQKTIVDDSGYIQGLSKELDFITTSYSFFIYLYH